MLFRSRHQIQSIVHLEKLIEAYNPSKILSKGYSITRVNGQILNNGNIKPGDEIETETHTIKLTSTVNKIQ